MQILRVQDPRDSLEKARRPDLVRFAREKGFGEITDEMPAILIRKLLRSRGIVNIQINSKPLGHTPGLERQPATQGQTAIVDEKVVTANAEDDLLEQFLAEQRRQSQQQKAAPIIAAPIPIAKPIKAKKEKKIYLDGEGNQITAREAKRLERMSHYKPIEKPIDKMKIYEVRQELIRLGVKPQRTMKMHEMKEVLRGKIAA